MYKVMLYSLLCLINAPHTLHYSIFLKYELNNALVFFILVQPFLHIFITTTMHNVVRYPYTIKHCKTNYHL